MNFFGISNNILSIILYIVTILVLVVFGIVISKILKKYINNIPEKKRTFLQKFLSDTIARNIIIIGGAFLILKFIIDPLFNYIFPAIAIGGSLIGGNNNDDQKEIEVNTNNNLVNIEPQQQNNDDDQKDIEINNIENNLTNIGLPQSLEHISSRMRAERQQQNELSNLSRPSFMEALPTRLNVIENNNDDEKIAEIPENNNDDENNDVNNEIGNNVNNEIGNNENQNENENNNIVLFPEGEKNQENVEDNNINIEPQQQNNSQIGGKKKIGRPKKIKSAAKVKLGKTNKWAIAVKRARKALGLTGFVPLNKGGMFYKTAKSFYYELTH